MILVEREDFEGLGFQKSLFYRKWIPGEPEAIANDYADVPAPGPFLIVAHEEAVWMSQDGKDWLKIATNTRYDGPEQRRWAIFAAMYAEEAGLSLRSLTYRIRSIRRRLAKMPGRWVPWSAAYHWDTGGDLVWSALKHHPRLEVRDEIRKEVRYGSQ